MKFFKVVIAEYFLAETSKDLIAASEKFGRDQRSFRAFLVVKK